MSWPQCPTNRMGSRYSVLCSDGYMYEQKCLSEWLTSSRGYKSPMTRQLIEFDKESSLEAFLETKRIANEKGSMIPRTKHLLD